MDTPNTVNELLDAQKGVDETPTPPTKREKEIAKIIKRVMKGGDPSVGLEVVKEIVHRLEVLHTNVLKDKVEEGDINEVCLWTKDLSTLRHIETLLETITL